MIPLETHTGYGHGSVVERFERIDRPYPWERKMTVCIAAACRDGKDHKIILCTDWQRSSPLGHAETMIKQRMLAKGWMCLTAGDEDDIQATLPLLRREFTAANIINETNVTPIVRNALNARKKQKADEHIHGKYALSYDDFLDAGKDKFPPELYRNALIEISAIQLEACFIIAGFTLAFPCLLETNKKCGVAIKEEFTTIGEGSYLATASLLHRQYSDIMNVNHALYCVYEAKKYAERVSSVGEYSSIAIISDAGTTQSVNLAAKDKLEAKYKEYGPKDVPNIIELGDNIYHE